MTPDDNYSHNADPSDYFSSSSSREDRKEQKTEEQVEQSQIVKKDRERNGQIDRLFYSETDQRLFYIPPYYTNGTRMLDQLIKNLTDAATILRGIMGNEGEIYCDKIRTSRRYKGMWYFAMHCEVAPPQAFQLGKDWDMFKWIED